jgi:type I restriction enzyme S subunit
MELKPGYKMTEVGVIPEDWEARRIGEVCRLINGRGFKPFEWRDTGLPIIRIQNLNGSNEFNFYAGAYDKKLEVEPGQLLFAWSGSRGTSFGPHVWHGPLGLLNYHTWKVHIYESGVNREFFLHALRQLTTFIEDRAHGASALVHTQKSEMEGFQFPLPRAKAEQEAIAEALSDADALIESLEQLLAKKRQIKQGAMQELLTGKRRLPGFSCEWETKRLGDLAVLSKAGINPAAYPNRLFTHFSLPAFDAGAVPIVQEGQFIGSNKFMVPSGAVLLSKLNPRIPRVWVPPVIPKDAVCSTEFLVLVPNEGTDRTFFAALCSSPVACYQMELHATGTTGSHQRIHASQALAIEVLSPSTKTEQVAIAAVLSDITAEIDALETKLAKARLLKQGMMQELLTGRTRLI